MAAYAKVDRDNMLPADVNRVGVPRDVGGVVAFLCSPEASFVSGAVLNIDGGYHL